MQGSKMVEQGDFYALMFFMVAIGNLVAYGILGWLTNIYAQVCLTKSIEVVCVAAKGDATEFRDHIC